MFLVNHRRNDGSTVDCTAQKSVNHYQCINKFLAINQFDNRYRPELECKQERILSDND